MCCFLWESHDNVGKDISIIHAMFPQASQSHCPLRALSPLRAFRASQASKRFSTVLLLLQLLKLLLPPPLPPSSSTRVPRCRQRSTRIWASSALVWLPTSRNGRQACERRSRELLPTRRWRRRRLQRQRRCCHLRQRLNTSMRRHLQ